MNIKNLKSFLPFTIVFLFLNSSAYALNEQEKSLLHYMCTDTYAGSLTEKNTNLLGQFIALTDHPEVQAYAKIENFESIASLFAKNINFTDDIGFMWMRFIEDRSKQKPKNIYYDQRKYPTYVPAANVQPSLAGGAKAKEVKPSLAGGLEGLEATATGSGAETLLSTPELTRENFIAYNKNPSFFYSLTIGQFSKFYPNGSTYTEFLDADHLEVWAGCLNTMYLKKEGSTEEEIHNFLSLFRGRIESLQGRKHPVLFLVDPRFYNEYSPIKRQNYKSEKEFLEIQQAVQTKLNDFSNCLIRDLIQIIPNLRIHFFNKTLNPMLQRLLRDSRGSVYIDNKIEAYGHNSNLQLPPELIDTLSQRAKGFEMLVSKEGTRGLRVTTHEQFGATKQFIDRNQTSVTQGVLQRWNHDNPQLQIEEREQK